jgi:hypothetical protein
MTLDASAVAIGRVTFPVDLNTPSLPLPKPSRIEFIVKAVLSTTNTSVSIFPAVTVPRLAVMADSSSTPILSANTAPAAIFSAITAPAAIFSAPTAPAAIFSALIAPANIFTLVTQFAARASAKMLSETIKPPSTTVVFGTVR